MFDHKTLIRATKKDKDMLDTILLNNELFKLLENNAHVGCEHYTPDELLGIVKEYVNTYVKAKQEIIYATASIHQIKMMKPSLIFINKK